VDKNSASHPGLWLPPHTGKHIVHRIDDTPGQSRVKESHGHDESDDEQQPYCDDTLLERRHRYPCGTPLKPSKASSLIQAHVSPVASSLARFI